jgi:hypothetical protein
VRRCWRLLPLRLTTTIINRERVYYESHKDYHEWNDQEDRAYRHYLEEHHRPYRNWKKANKRDQEAYWAWRNNHQAC